MKSLSVTIRMKATEQFFPVVLYIMLYKVVLESVNKILTCDHLSKNKISQVGWFTILQTQTCGLTILAF